MEVTNSLALLLLPMSSITLWKAERRMWTAWRRWEKTCRNGVKIFENEQAATGGGKKNPRRNRRKSQLRKENKVSFNRAEKGTWIYYFILAFDSYCSAIFLFWARRILFINPEVEEMTAERRRGSRTGETERRGEKKEKRMQKFFVLAPSAGPHVAWERRRSWHA